MQGIYRIRNKLNGKYYIGSSVDAESRWEGHYRQLKNGVHNHLLQPAWDKYGEENFEFEFVKEVEEKEDLHPIEQRHLDRGFEKDVLYNIARKAGAPPAPEIGHEVSKETRAKLSKTKLGKNNPMWGRFGKDHPSYGIRCSEETRAKLSKALSAENHPQYGKKRPNLSKRMMGRNNPNYGKDMSGENNPFYGKHHTKEWKHKKSKQMLGEKHRLYGKRRSEETKAKLSKASAKPYPAFYNVKTGELIPTGKNLLNLCSELDLNYGSMWNIKKGVHKLASDCWRVAIEEEIFMN